MDFPHIRPHASPPSLALAGSPPCTAGQILQDLPHSPTRVRVSTQKKAKEEPIFPPSVTTHEFCNAPVKPAQELSFPLVGTRRVTQLWLSRNVQCIEQQHGAKGAKFGPNAFPIDTLKPVES